MKHYKAIITEAGKNKGQSIGTTKSGKYKGMSKDVFYNELKKSTVFTFEIIELIENHEI